MRPRSSDTLAQLRAGTVLAGHGCRELVASSKDVTQEKLGLRHEPLLAGVTRERCDAVGAGCCADDSGPENVLLMDDQTFEVLDRLTLDATEVRLLRFRE